MVQYDKLVSVRQQMYTQRLQRALMTNPDNKRYQIDSIHSLPYGFKVDWVPPLSTENREAFLGWTDDAEMDDVVAVPRRRICRPRIDSASGDESDKRARLD